MFPDAKISCAHDFGQTPLDPGSYPTFVSFVRPHVSTRWGHISCIHAAMRALRELYEKEDPDWFVLMSGSDYPVVTADTILSELKAGRYDAYLDYREVTYGFSRPGWVPLSLDHREVTYGFSRPGWVPLAYDRYVAKLVINYPSMTKRLRPTRRNLFIRHPWLAWPFHPFRSSLRCFGGDEWFTANRRVARILLDEYENGERLIKHFSKRPVPDEAFYQTVICNQPGLRVSGIIRGMRIGHWVKHIPNFWMLVISRRLPRPELTLPGSFDRGHQYLLCWTE
jgi:Core-2/I-Branching enzyme